MKTYFAVLFGAATLALGAASCSSKPDSVEQAQATNNANKGMTNADTTVTTAQGVSGVQRPAFDSQFMTKAASGGMLEVQLGQAMAKRATSPEVKQFAQEMVTDHTKNNDQLKALAAQKNITLPTTLGEDQQKVYDDVLAEKGPALDQKYVQAMLADHGDDIKEYQEAIAKSGDRDIQAFAQQTLPVLQMHLGMAQKIQPIVEAKK
jgi:putative membrane protein